MGLFKKKIPETFKISPESYDLLFSDILDNVSSVVDSVCTLNKLTVSPSTTKEIQIKNPSESSITKNLKSLPTLLIDNDLINLIVEKLTFFFETKIYNHFITFLDSDKLKEVNEKLESSKDIQEINIDLNSYVDDLDDKNFLGILKKIHEIILDCDLPDNIKKIIQTAEQFNFILINTIKFLSDSGSSFTKEMFNSKKYTTDYLYDYEGSLSKIVELIKSFIDENGVIKKCLEAFNIEKAEDESIITLSEGDKIEKESLLSDKDNIEVLDIEAQTSTPSNTGTMKNVLKSKSTYIIGGSILSILVTLGSAFYYYATYIGF